MQSDPHSMANKMIVHFQRLFDVPTAEGVFPRMTELWKFASEIKPQLEVISTIVFSTIASPLDTATSWCLDER